MQAKIQLVSTRVDSLSLERSIALERSKGDSDNDNSAFSLEVGTGFPIDEADQHFIVTLISEIQTKEGFILKVRHVTRFLVDEKITDEFKKSHFPVINAPAIAFPYFRAFISTFLINAGFEIIILPSINFLQLHQNNQANQEVTQTVQ